MTFEVFVSLAPVKPTIVYDTYWRFAAERQRIFFSRISGAPRPWSEDPIFAQYKFTNAYRAADRVSQYLIRNVIYKGKWDVEDTFFRIMLFKLFNKIETWEMLSNAFEEVCLESYSYKNFDRVLTKAMDSGKKIYSAAYIMASGGQIFNVARKHQSHLKLIEYLIHDEVPRRLAECRTMRQGFELLRSYPLIGNFLAYQLITDINYSTLTNFSEMEFTFPGPGAKDGLKKCFSSFGGLSEQDLIRLMVERQEIEFTRLGIQFQSLWGRPIQLIDAQNLFCEVDKYARMKHPDIAGISGRTRIKQKFSENKEPIEYFFPPKWELKVSSKVAKRTPFKQPKLF